MATSLLDRGDARALVRFLMQTNTAFDLIRSNYAMEIKSELIREKFVTSMQGKSTFAAFAKIKSNVKDKKIPNVNRDDLVYYQHNFRSNSFTQVVSNIDLNCAYATCLFNEGFITKETMQYLLRLPKQARLVSVGMLASRKKTFTYRQGVITDYDENVSEYAPFFYLAVKRTFEIMSDLKRIIGDRYLFTWVDGIYYLPDNDKTKECESYLRNINFGFKTEELHQFKVDALSSKIMLTFKKYSEKKGEWETKLFNLPYKETLSDKIALSIVNYKNVKNENVLPSHPGKRGRRVG